MSTDVFLVLPDSSGLFCLFFHMEHDIHLKSIIEEFRAVDPELAKLSANLDPVVEVRPAATRFVSIDSRCELRDLLLHLRLQAAFRH